jgi:hypothetical protein
MAHAALAVSPAAHACAPADAGAAPPEASGFELGWDFAHHRMVPPADHMHPGHPVRQGWDAGRAAFGQRTLRASAPVKKWLQLRLNAWHRGRAFEPVQVTPHFLAQIQVACCPITRQSLSQATSGPCDASIDRVNNDGGYAAGNLAVMSVRANRAKAAFGFSDALGFARRIEAGECGRIDGLDAAQWLRLAVLMSFATPLTHAQATTLPLLVLPPNRLRVLNPVQALQVLLTLQFTQPAQVPRLDALAGLFGGEARQAFHVFMNTLLARRVASGPQADAPALRRAMEDAWGHPLVQRRWQRLALRLDAVDCERIVDRAVARGLALPGLRCLPLAQATEGWALAQRGRVAAPAAPAEPAGSAGAFWPERRRLPRWTAPAPSPQLALC